MYLTNRFSGIFVVTGLIENPYDDALIPDTVDEKGASNIGWFDGMWVGFVVEGFGVIGALDGRDEGTFVIVLVGDTVDSMGVGDSEGAELGFLVGVVVAGAIVG